MRAIRLVSVLTVVAAITFVCFRILAVNATTVAMAFFLSILVIAARWGLVEAVLASLAAMLCFNFFFLPPVGTFTIADPQNWVALFVFLATSIIASQLSARAKHRAEEAQARQQEMERLYELSRALLLTESGQPVAAAVTRQIIRIFGWDSVAFYDRQRGEVFRAGSRDLAVSDARMMDSALQAATFHDAEPGAGAATIPVSLGGQSVGSISVPDGAISEPALHAIVNLAAIALEREQAQAIAARGEAMRHSEELKSTLLDAVAHEFKTPLTSIKAAATAMLSSVSNGSEQHELLTIVDEEAERLNEMVSDAIRMASIEAGQVQLHKQVVAIPELFASVVKGAASLLEERRVDVLVAPDLPVVVADREMISLVLRQILNNAAKYSPPGSPIMLEANSQAGVAVIAVSDTGPGIPHTEQAHVFDKFYRARNLRGRIPGTGMGLTIAREIVNAHQGQIWVESKPGQGSCFSFSLPSVAQESGIT